MYRKLLRAEGPGIADQTYSDEVNISTPDEFQVSGCYFARRVQFYAPNTLRCADCVFCGPVFVYAERCTFTRCMFTWGSKQATIMAFWCSKTASWTGKLKMPVSEACAQKCCAWK